mmetsp:Transcript_7278/g.27251  ORF Transcript_7278/g.27251 Transcript_7278/m.27251 type:complete len:294 (-) Transcript_7278:280-1161(-)
MSLEAPSKHPLNSPWTLWFYSVPSKGYKPMKYSDYLRKVYNFENVEDFWCVYNHITKPSKLKPNDAMMLFREDIKPEWEDLKNKQGGEWRVTFSERNFSRSLDSAWENLLMWAIGEMFSHSDEVQGVYLNIKESRSKSDKRPGLEYRLSLWTRNSGKNMSNTIKSLGEELKTCLGCPRNIIPRLEFRVHADYYGGTSSYAKKPQPQEIIEPDREYNNRSRGPPRPDQRGGHRGGRDSHPSYGSGGRGPPDSRSSYRGGPSYPHHGPGPNDRGRGGRPSRGSRGGGGGRSNYRG